jgi:hypothetical protein
MKKKFLLKKLYAKFSNILYWRGIEARSTEKDSRSIYKISFLLGVRGFESHPLPFISKLYNQ